MDVTRRKAAALLLLTVAAVVALLTPPRVPLAPEAASATGHEHLPPMVALVYVPEGIPDVSIVGEDGTRSLPASVERHPDGLTVVVLPFLQSGTWEVRASVDVAALRVTRTLEVPGVLLYGRPFGALLEFRNIPTGSPSSVFDLARSGQGRFVVFEQSVEIRPDVLLTVCAAAMIFGWLARRPRVVALLLCALAVVLASAAGIAAALAALLAAGAVLLAADWAVTTAAVAVVVVVSLSPGGSIPVAMALGCLVAGSVFRAVPARVKGLLVLMIVSAGGAGVFLSGPQVPVADREECLVQYKSDDPHRAYCLARALAPMFDAAPERVLVAVDALVDEGVLDVCHGVAHTIGRRAAHADDPFALMKLVGGSCSYGYVHGMTDEAATTMGTEEFVAFLASTCYAAGDPMRLECSHGAGHALFQRTGGDMFAALSACAVLDSSPHSECLTGVFMSSAEQYIMRDRIAPGASDWRPAGMSEQALRTLPLVDESHEVCRLVAPLLTSKCLLLSMRSMSEKSSTFETHRRAVSLLTWCMTEFPGVSECVAGVVWSLFPAGVTPGTLPDPAAAAGLCRSAGTFTSECLREFVQRSVYEYLREGWGEERIVTALCPGLQWRDCTREVATIISTR